LTRINADERGSRRPDLLQMWDIRVKLFD